MLARATEVVAWSGNWGSILLCGLNLEVWLYIFSPAGYVFAGSFWEIRRLDRGVLEFTPAIPTCPPTPAPIRAPPYEKN